MARRAIGPVATALGAADVLVLERSGRGWRLLGGAGRGASWAGTVDVQPTGEALLRKAKPGKAPVRVEEAAPVRVVGPYWSAHAALIPVGDDHVVVAGGEGPIRGSDAELLRHAAEAVAAVGDVSSAKLLADELEVVDAVRHLMHYRPEKVQDTARHIAEVAAGALSCEFAAVMVRSSAGLLVERAGATTAECADPQLCADMQRLSRRLRVEPLLEQDLSDGGTPGSEHGLVSRYALAIGSGKDRAVLVVGHGAVRPRGFTNLCLRVGRSIADAAEVLLSQALAREELGRERDQFAREARTDELTGLANRVAWTEALDNERPRRSRYRRPVIVMSVDVDALKQANDRFGHDAGDELLRGVAGILRRNLRDADVVARIGGDEFGVLLPETQPDAMPALVERIQIACRAWRGTQPDLQLSVSIGWAAPEPFGDLREALRIADDRMYLAKRGA
jgi:diguanylate cyclase (GGDEF)-like protein